MLLSLITSHFRAYYQFALGLTLRTILHLDDIPGYQRMQIFVFPESLARAWASSLASCDVFESEFKISPLTSFQTTVKRFASR